jgi:hypothetical protein
MCCHSLPEKVTVRFNRLMRLSWRRGWLALYLGSVNEELLDDNRYGIEQRRYYNIVTIFIHDTGTSLQEETGNIQFGMSFEEHVGIMQASYNEVAFV